VISRHDRGSPWRQNALQSPVPKSAIGRAKFRAYMLQTQSVM
jgi:hypothetical protein